jgi:DNA-binding XRE family transcriptional regulator
MSLVQSVIYDIRNGFGLSRRKFAKLLGVSSFTIFCWEIGIRKPDFLQMRKLMRWRKVLCRLEEVLEPSSISWWFNTPKIAFGGKIPFEVACSSPNGDKKFLDFVSRLEYGILD